MTTFTDTAYAYSSPSFESRPNAAQRFLRRVDGWLERQAIRAELSSLDARTLADLGINRGDFPSIVNGSFQHPRSL